MKASNDKQKILIMAVLTIGLLGVGAFQFMGKGPEPVKTTEKKQDKAVDPAAETGENSTNQQLHDLQPLTQRDPFDRKITGPEGASPPIAGGPVVTVPTPPMPPEPTIPVTTQVGPGTTAQNGIRPMKLDGDFGAPPLPNVNQGGPSNFNSGPETSEPARPSMRLSGVVVGDKPMAVVTDENGKQKLVKVGDELPDKRKVVAIQRDKVVLASDDPKDKETLTIKRDVGK